jgi:hypothetical protein
MMTTEERTIRNLKRFTKQRKLRIVVFTFLAVLMLGCTAWLVSRRISLDAKLTPERIRAMASFENPKHELPILFSRFYTLSTYSAKLEFYVFYFAGIAGLFIGLLIMELAHINTHQLTLSMLDRIEKLEAEAVRRRSHPDKDGQETPEGRSRAGG